MSWLWSPNGVAAKPQPAEEMVPDPGNPNKMVAKKAANRPFLAYHEYKLERERQHQAWLERKKAREEKLARGEVAGPEERDPTAEEEVGLLGLLKFLVLLVLIIVLASKFFTGSFLWEYDGKWVQLKTYWPQDNGRLFSESYLATFDGTDANKPIYIAIDGAVYDVSSNRRTYGPGGSYHSMAGVDAARSFATGCFATHRTHDLRGLTDQEVQGVQHWKKYFGEHKSYFKVGRVLHHPIDPQSPIPEPCDSNKEQTARPKKGSEDSGKPPVQPNPPTQRKSEREEL